MGNLGYFQVPRETSAATEFTPWRCVCFSFVLFCSRAPIWVGVERLSSFFLLKGLQGSKGIFGKIRGLLNFLRIPYDLFVGQWFESKQQGITLHSSFHSCLRRIVLEWYRMIEIYERPLLADPNTATKNMKHWLPNGIA